MDSNERNIPGSIPDAPNLGVERNSKLPALSCPNPGIYLDPQNRSKGDIERPRKRSARRRRNTSTAAVRERSRITEDRDRIDRIQAALILARRRTIDPLNEGTPFDLRDNADILNPDIQSFFEVTDNARILER